jgi:hypothetical protein
MAEAGTAGTSAQVPKATLTAYQGVVTPATLEAGPRTNQNTVIYRTQNNQYVNRNQTF